SILKSQSRQLGSPVACNVDIAAEYAPSETDADADQESGRHSVARHCCPAVRTCRSRNNVDSQDPEHSASLRFPDLRRAPERSHRPRRLQFSNAYSLTSLMAS